MTYEFLITIHLKKVNYMIYMDFRKLKIVDDGCLGYYRA